MTKTYYAEKMGIDPKDIVVCQRHALHRQEVRDRPRRSERCRRRIPDVDISITTRELARMIKRAGIKLCRPARRGVRRIRWAIGTGAAVIFGATGGVMEAALQHRSGACDGRERWTKLEFHEVRGTDGHQGSQLRCGRHGR